MAKGKTKGIGIWIIVGLLCIALLGFGTGGLSGAVRSIGTVGDLPVSTQAYFNAVNAEISRESARAQRRISFPEAEENGLPLRALARVVQERAIDNEALQLGVSVGNSVISEQVLANPSFRGTDGTFDEDRYGAQLADRGLNVRTYETALREQATRALLQGAVFAGVPDPQVYGETAARFSRETRTFTWAEVTANDIEVDLPTPTQDDLEAHYNANIDAYTSLETRKIRYVWLTPEMIQDQVPVDEEELRAEYEARSEEYIQPERRLIERLLFDDVASAQAALDVIEAGEKDFPQVVQEAGFSLSDVDGGDVTEAEMGEAGPAIFALETGGVTGPFDTEFGPALYRMNAVLAARTITFEQAKDDLREDQAAQRAMRLIDDQIDPIANLLAGGASLEDVAADTDMELGELDWTVVVRDGIAAYAEFRDLAAAQSTEDFAELADLSDGGLFALEVLEVRPPAPIPLEDIREDVTRGWEEEQTAAAVLAAAQGKMAQLREGVQSFAFLDLEGTQENDMRRVGVVTGTPPDFLTQVFEMETGDVRVLPNGGNAIVVRLDGISAANPEDGAFVTEAESLAQIGGEGMAQDIYEVFARTVQTRTDISINDAAVNAVHSNFQ